MLKEQKKHINKEQDKTKHEAPRSVNYRATQNKNNIGTTALEHRRLKFYVLTHNNPTNPDYLLAISLLQVRHFIYLFLIILGPNFKRLCLERSVVYTTRGGGGLKAFTVTNFTMGFLFHKLFSVMNHLSLGWPGSHPLDPGCRFDMLCECVKRTCWQKDMLGHEGEHTPKLTTRH